MRDGRGVAPVLPQSPEPMGTRPWFASGEGSAAPSVAGRRALSLLMQRVGVIVFVLDRTSIGLLCGA